MNGKWIAFVALLCLSGAPSPAVSQGFAGLGTAADGFAVPHRSTRLTFPQDHGAHPGFRIEWWYVTANLTAADGTPYGVQWTLFRSALAPDDPGGWQSAQVWMAHAALTSRDSHRAAEKLSRGGIGQAGVTAQPFDARIDDWQLQSRDGSFNALRLRADAESFGFDLDLTAQSPLVFHGDHGYSVKSSAGQASHYYSQPNFAVAGTLQTAKGEVAVTGRAWLDREWSSQPLAGDQSGWDWFSLSFEDGSQLMGFVLRGGEADFTSGTWIDRDGSVVALSPGQFTARPLQVKDTSEGSVPTRWQVSVPQHGVDVRVDVLNPNAWMDLSFPYWEGPVQVSGSHQGVGYLEMTGRNRADP